MNIKSIILTSLIFFAGVLGLVGCTGCATQLAPQGVYQGDTVLYRAELASVSSYQLVDTFLKWEYDNRALLSTHPEIKQAADFLRVNYPSAKTNLDAAIEKYRVLATPENKALAESWLAKVQEYARTVANYMTP
jgi:hypothetical protein